MAVVPQFFPLWLSLSRTGAAGRATARGTLLLRGKAEDDERLFESDELAPAEPTLPATAEARDTSLAEPEPALESAFEPALEPD